MSKDSITDEMSKEMKIGLLVGTWYGSNLPPNVVVQLAATLGVDMDDDDLEFACYQFGLLCGSIIAEPKT